jgi:DNA-binding CsgD family transcriptional regulator
MPSAVREAIDLLSRSGEAAFAIDATDRIVYWNEACEKVLSLDRRKVLGKYCYDVLRGRDDFGNLYCFKNCPVAHQARTDDEPDVQPFYLTVRDGAGKTRRLATSMFAIPAARPTLSAIVHVIREEEGADPSPLEHKLAAVASDANPIWPISGPPRPGPELTGREKEILRCMSEGLSTAAIAARLFISPVTVRNHTQNILHKLDVHTKLAAVVYAYRNQLI